MVKKIFKSLAVIEEIVERASRMATNVYIPPKVWEIEWTLRGMIFYQKLSHVDRFLDLLEGQSYNSSQN